MPSIIQDSKQLAALKEVEADLDAIQQINTLLAESPSTFHLAMVPKKGKPTYIQITEADQDAFTALANKIKARLVKAVTVKANKYHIAFSDREKALLADDSDQQRPKGKKEPTPQPADKE